MSTSSGQCWTRRRAPTVTEGGNTLSQMETTLAYRDDCHKERWTHGMIMKIKLINKKIQKTCMRIPIFVVCFR